MVTILFILIGFLLTVSQDTWDTRIEQQIIQIDKEMPGNLGVYVKYLGDEKAYGYKADSEWYLSSTIKIPLAIAILQKAEAGELSLEDKITLRESDFVDGAGDLLWEKPGTTFTIASLIEKSVINSDSSATDMLIGLIGEDAFNQQIREKMVPEGINQLTTILRVRYDAYAELHEKALELTNMDILHVHSTRSRPERLNRLIEKMSVDKSELNASSIEEAFERYYERGLNSGKLESMGLMLERLYNGELLSEKNTDFLLNAMKSITTGDNRIKAGLPRDIEFAQKTGTQIRQACNIGIIFPDDRRNSQPIIIAACIKDFDEISEAEQTFESVGRAVTEALLK
jgi:beta-lactamase class A